MTIFATNSYPVLARRVARLIGASFGRASFGRFRDGELFARIARPPKAGDVFVFGSLQQPDQFLLEMLWLLNAVRHGLGKRATAVIPYLGYARQDRSDPEGSAVNAEIMAKLLSAAGARKVITVDAHSPRVSRYFDIPFAEVSAAPLFAEQLKKMNRSDLAIAAPDMGAAHRARKVAALLGMRDLALVHKERLAPGRVRAVRLAGRVRGKTVCFVDDMIDTGGTLAAAARLVRRSGAKRVIAVATHGIWSKGAFQTLRNAGIEKIFVADTIPQKRLPAFVSALSCAKLLAQKLTNVRLDF